LDAVSVGQAGTGRPRRAEGIEIDEAADGYVVYHPALDRVHYLNHTAVIVLELCTGDNDTAAIASFVGSAYELAEPPAAEVGACLERLAREGLVS
jgi:hypothetical protein